MNNSHLEIGRRLVTEVLSPMKLVFVGKDEIIDVLGVCLVGGENAFLLGPPGTAKSALVFELGRRLQGATFEYLLTRFTEPNELFGPFDIRRLREGELVTNTEGMLPEASFVFLDELLNANSAILNSLLTVLNERVFRRGQEKRRLPMIMAVGASNRLPEDEALRALFDRFLLRVHCDSVPDDRLGDVMAAGWELEQPRGEPAAVVSMEEVRLLNRALCTVDLAPVRQPMVDLVRRLRQAGLDCSDRRAVKLQRLVAASALLCGREVAHRSDLWVFRYIWESLEQEEILTHHVDEALGVRGGGDGEGGGDDDRIDTAHPRSRQSDLPDPELLGRDLAAVAARLAEPELPEAEKSRLRDHLRSLASRAQWVAEEESRSFLLREVERLWSGLGEEASTG